MKKGKELGRKEVVLEMVKRLKAEGVTLQKIKKLTGLTEKDLHSIL